ncbi:hypothetical protein KYI13_12460 (plasmid) [Macrococcoides bohemicum]|uniref:hypothetical protein n=1 Tax=Macrococcoides bohemicum TaxID=1903056 RepID=UPI001C5E82F2|nr:hypothetical protein [Macrococcus bohemicus]QYA46098.1 hypothetical protein KYI13_12460 [Macrococcus bohemicus]
MLENREVLDILNAILLEQKQQTELKREEVTLLREIKETQDLLKSDLLLRENGRIAVEKALQSN